MHQTWDKLLFLHWPVELERLQPLIPAGLEIDSWNNTAWIGVTPFTMRVGPALPLVSKSHERNVRTYVHRDDVPGAWLAVSGIRFAMRKSTEPVSTRPS